MENMAIHVRNVTKTYKLYKKPVDRLKESLHPGRKTYHSDFHALHNLSFEIKKGETIGIIGKNGSGKSTLLKIITGVLQPTTGAVQVSGKVSALLELGAGFNPEMTGIENIYLNGMIMGYTKEEIDEKLADILSFADIGDFIDQPVKTYSSGMFVRLAFAVASSVEPEILIVDEALSVGDIRFQQKCLRRIEELKGKNTILFVSHDLGIISKFCDRCIWINEGELYGDGAPVHITKRYQAFMADSRTSTYKENGHNDSHNNQKSTWEIEPIQPGLDVLGDNQAQVLGISLLDLHNNRVSMVSPGKESKLVIRVQFSTELVSPIIGFMIKDRLGNIVTQSNNAVLDKGIENTREEIQDFCFQFTIPSLNNGYYTISPAVASGTMEDHVQHCLVHDAVVFQIVDTTRYPLQGFIFIDEIDFYKLT